MKTTQNDITITPELAQKWLSQNNKNRKANMNIVVYYAQQIRDGAWENNSQPIIFGKSGNLLDGQHRLLAVVSSNTSIVADVVWGVNDSVFDTIDTGKPRSAADVLLMSGEKNANNTVSALRVILSYKKQIAARGQTHSTREIEEALLQFPHVRESVSMANCAYEHSGNTLLSPSKIAGLHAISCYSDKSLADLFLQRLGTGEKMSVDNPCLRLRERMRLDKAKKTPFKQDHIRLYTKAWNLFQAGKTVKTLKLSENYDINEYQFIGAPPELFNAPISVPPSAGEPS